ncbi:MAG: ABC transporter substrate-binding protein [Pseudobdellovibrio sp.]
MKVISFVPSLTETLITAGVTVVGRTRFCIHPEDKVKSLPVVGGTKNLDLEKIKELKPDLVIFDKEENNKEMFDECLESRFKCYATHITNIQTCGEELKNLGRLLSNDELNLWGEQYLSFVTSLNKEALKLKHIYKSFLKVDTLNAKHTSFGENNHPQQMLKLFDHTLKGSHSLHIHYVIWKNPFMIVNQNTFIADVLRLFDVNVSLNEKKYVEISENDLKSKFCFFSSEPYPFHKDYFKLLDLGYQGILVDGEKISWYGIRNLKFLLDK